MQPTEATPLAASSSSEEERRKLPRDAPALNAFRLFAALHIVAFHQNAFGGPPHAFDGPSTGNSFAQWGPAWLPFFFMLSGFGPVHSRLCKAPVSRDDAVRCKDVLPSPQTLLRRLVSVWPTYAFALIIGFISINNPSLPERNWALFMLELLLVHHWFTNTLRAQLLIATGHPAASLQRSDFNDILSYNGPDWYVSVLAFYWLFENACFELGAVAARRGALGLGVAFGVLLLFMLWAPAAFPLIWGYGPPQLPAFLWWLNTDLLIHMHQYAAGVLLAFFLHHRANEGSPPVFGTYCACSVGTVVFFALLFLLPRSDSNTVYQWGTLFGAFMPLYALIVAGCLESTRDYLPWLLSKWPLPTIAADFALPIYVLQAPALQIFFGVINQPSVNRLRDESEPFRMVVGIISPILLGLVSVFLLQKPANKLAKWMMPATFGGAKKAAEATGETKGDGNA